MQLQVYVLARDRKGCTAEKRLLRLLHSGLFNAVRDDPTLRAKVVLLKVGARACEDDGVSAHLRVQRMHECIRTSICLSGLASLCEDKRAPFHTHTHSPAHSLSL